MQRAFLIVRGEFGREYREHRLANDRRLDEGTRVDPDDRRAVIERVEVVLLRLRIHRMRAPERDVGIASEIDLLPLVETRRVRPDQDADVLQPRIAAAAYRLDPPLRERRLERRAPEQRRAHIQDEPTIGAETHAIAKRLVAARRLPIEPLVETVRAGDHDTI